MTGAPAASGLSLDPRVVTDLLAAPDAVRDLALTRLGEVTAVAEPGGGTLTGELAGFRELPLGESVGWSLVYARRPAPPASAHRTEVHVVAARPAASLYDTVRARLGLTRPVSALTHAARTSSPQLPTATALTGRAVPSARPGLPPSVPLTPLTVKGPSR
ncbi:hypothetical protein ACFRI7_11685 [Streptomyces sp. NPDC056716]|uniref:hypothetical protein n=1 Tax=unclassified Streptomyces TaxID=2593676 RepID=UPI003676E089